MMDIYRQGWWWAVRGVYDGERWVNGSLRVLQALESVGVQFRIENLGMAGRIKGPVVFIANHMSTLETFVLPCLIHPKKKITFIVKESLLKFPVFGRVLRARKPVAVGRKDPRQDLRVVLEECTATLAKGRSIVVFPQTTRSGTFVPEQFNTLGIKLARRAGVPVVPIALKTDAWAVGRPLRDFGPIRPEKTVHFAFGEPIIVEGSGRVQHEEVVRFIKDKLREWEKETG
jgi:1-acyl-sn-glycerol-3-phosphate acyltransferase